MKRIIVLTIALIGLLSACVTTYKTQYGGKEDKASILILSADGGREFSDIVVNIDGKEYEVDKVYSEKKYQKALPIVIYAGKHKITIKKDAEVLLMQNIFIGVQETRKIIIR
jgi:hypothetical protein